MKNRVDPIFSDYKAAVKLIRDARNIAIAGHINPDGDSIGSTLALGGFLRQMRKKVVLLSPGGVPNRYKFLPCVTQLKETSRMKFDLAISIDCASSKQLGRLYDQVFRPADKILEIDHHPVRHPFGNLVLLDERAAAVGEIVFRLRSHLGVRLTKETAFNILTAIVVETNSFQLPNVTHFTFKAAWELMSEGVDFYELVNNLYWNRTKSEVISSGLCLARMKFLANGALAYSYLNQKDRMRLRGKDEDIDAVADQMRSVGSVKVVVLFRELNRNMVRISLRSKEGINVAGLAEEFGGAGHFDVAGCEIPNTAASKKRLLERAVEILRAQ